MMTALVARALSRLDEAIRLYAPSKVIALFSGGYDSLCATQHPRFAGVLHINTGIGIPQTRHFVRATCRAYGWPLLEYRSPIRYEDIVLTDGYGMPGPALHSTVYSKLKERALRLFMAITKPTCTIASFFQPAREAKRADGGWDTHKRSAERIRASG